MDENKNSNFFSEDFNLVKIIEIILLVGTVIFAYKAWQESQRQADISNSALIDSRNAIDSTAIANFRRDTASDRISQERFDSTLNISDSVLVLAKRNFQIENRPILYYKDVSIKPFTENSNEFEAKGNIVNIGKTQALNVRYALRFLIDSFPKRFAKSPIIRKDFNPIIDLPPTATHIAGNISNFSINKITPDDVKKILSKKLFLYFYGKITYKDIFGKDYFTTLCIVYNPDDLSLILYNPVYNDIK